MWKNNWCRTRAAAWLMVALINRDGGRRYGWCTHARLYPDGVRMNNAKMRPVLVFCWQLDFFVLFGGWEGCMGRERGCDQNLVCLSKLWGRLKRSKILYKILRYSRFFYRYYIIEYFDLCCRSCVLFKMMLNKLFFGNGDLSKLVGSFYIYVWKAQTESVRRQAWNNWLSQRGYLLNRKLLQYH